MQQAFHELCAVSHIEAPACLGDLKAQKVDCVAFVGRRRRIRQMQTGLHVFSIAHEVFFWSRAQHVIHVNQEDRIICSSCTFLYVR